MSRLKPANQKTSAPPRLKACFSRRPFAPGFSRGYGILIAFWANHHARVRDSPYAGAMCLAVSGDEVSFARSTALRDETVWVHGVCGRTESTKPPL